MCASYYDENYIKKIINKLEEDLYPSLGKLSSYEIHEKEEFIFSQICRIKLNYNETTKNVVLKKYLKKSDLNSDIELSVESEYNILKYLHQSFASLQYIDVINPLAFISEEDILITEEFVADKLNSLIVNEVRWIPSKEKKKQIKNYFFQCGRWLRYFQKFTKRDEVTPFSQDRYIENIEKKLTSSIKYGLKNTFHKKIYQFIDDRFKRIGDQKFDLVGYHGDFTPWNVLANDNKVKVLDFTLFSCRNSYEDLTLFLSALEGGKSIVGIKDKNIDILKDAFSKGYKIERMNHDILELYLLKNALKTLNMIDVNKDANTKFFDVHYEKYRKKRQIKVYLNYVNHLVDGS